MGGRGGILSKELLGPEKFALGGAEEHLGNNNIDQVLGMGEGLCGDKRYNRQYLWETHDGKYGNFTTQGIVPNGIVRKGKLELVWCCFGPGDYCKV